MKKKNKKSNKVRSVFYDVGDKRIPPEIIEEFGPDVCYAAILDRDGNVIYSCSASAVDGSAIGDSITNQGLRARILS